MSCAKPMNGNLKFIKSTSMFDLKLYTVARQAFTGHQISKKLVLTMGNIIAELATNTLPWSCFQAVTLFEIFVLAHLRQSKFEYRRACHFAV